MIFSMTGYGRGESTGESGVWVVEVSSVNRRQLDVVVSLPKGLLEVEGKIRQVVQGEFSRGRFHVAVMHSASSGDDSVRTLVFDESLAGQYLAAIREFGRNSGIALAWSTSDLLRAPGVFSVKEKSEANDADWLAIEAALLDAVRQLKDSRREEGASLADEILLRLKQLEKGAKLIEKLAPKVPEQHRELLRTRLEEAGVPLDLSDERLVREIALFADRCDISEELSRLKCHYRKFDSLLNAEESNGRAMDFLLQEINRELNTIGSKCNHAEIAHHVVGSKTEVEKIREQVQNIE